MHYQTRITFTTKPDEDSDAPVYCSERFVVDMNDCSILIHDDMIGGMLPFNDAMKEDMSPVLVSILSLLRTIVTGELPPSIQEEEEEVKSH